MMLCLIGVCLIVSKEICMKTDSFIWSIWSWIWSHQVCYCVFITVSGPVRYNVGVQILNLTSNSSNTTSAA